MSRRRSSAACTTGSCAVPSGRPSCANAAASTASAERRTSAAIVASATPSASSATARPMRSRWLASRAAPMRAATASPGIDTSSGARTRLASVGVNAASVSTRRRTRRSTTRRMVIDVAIVSRAAASPSIDRTTSSSVPRELGQRAVEVVGHDDQPVELADRRRAQLAPQHRVHELASLQRQQTEGDHSTRTDLHDQTGGSGVVANVAVAAETMGAHRHGRHHRAMPAHRRTLVADDRHALAQHGDVGGGATDVGDHRIGRAGEVCRTHQAGGRARQDRLDRPVAHERGRHERTVAAHHHQRCDHAVLGERLLGGGDELVDDRDQPGVQHRGDGALRSVQPRRQLVAARHRLAGAAMDQFGGRHLVFGVAHAELRGHGKCIDHRCDLVEPSVERGEVERLQRRSVRIVAATQEHRRVAGQRLGQTPSLGHGIVEADHHRAHGSPAALDQCVGCQRGRQRDELDVGRVDRCVAQRSVDRAADADGQVVMRGRCLGGGHHRSVLLVVHHGVGVRAAGVDAQQQGS